MNEDKELSFESAAKHLLEWLNNNANPHAIVIVEAGGAVLYSGEKSVVTEECIRD
ncbi:hypothetical protein OFY05_11365 [Pseudocitrobacter faecalis]|nr:hypothetical protein OFY05_11365 [Pseudocitrobacter faecalis]